MVQKIKIGMTKGRLLKNTIKLLEEAGIDCSPLKEDSRKLVFLLPDYNIEAILLKAADVPTYVEHGVVDMGIAGKDVLLEQGKQLYEVLDLKIGQCKLAVAGKPAMKEGKKHLVVASKYTNVAAKYFAEKGQSVEIIKQEGSVELAPIMGLSDIIVDIVETGKTLKENGLVVLEDIADVSARLILNEASYKTKKREMSTIIDLIEKAVK